VVVSEEEEHFPFDLVLFLRPATASKRRVAMEHIIAGKFKLGRKIGSGSFGELYLGMLHVAYAQNGCHCINVYVFCMCLSLIQVLIYRTERKWE
jgi:hypothetical protein